jgi:hypothetical protein
MTMMIMTMISATLTTCVHRALLFVTKWFDIPRLLSHWRHYFSKVYILVVQGRNILPRIHTAM